MNTFIRKTLPFFLLLSISHQVLAVDVTIVPSIAYQHKQLSFDQAVSGVINGDSVSSAEFDVIIPTINLSLTTAVDKWYFSLKYEEALTEGTTEVDETERTITAVNLFTVDDGEVSVERTDVSFTVGYNIWDRLNVFTGYMSGETTIRPDASCPLTLNTNPPSCPQINLAVFNKVFGGPDFEQTYKEKGLYIGASYAWQVAEVGTISLSAAYADMKGELEDNGIDGFGNDDGLVFEGDSNGLSLGVTWTQPLGDNSSYFIDVRRQAYSMTGTDQSGDPDYVNAKVKTDEVMLGLTAGLQFYF